MNERVMSGAHKYERARIYFRAREKSSRALEKYTRANLFAIGAGNEATRDDS